MKRNNNNRPSWLFTLPFFIVLALLTVVSFIIPLRPTQSMNEKRNLAEFPEFSLEALASGSYFDDITLWFSDTFPFRDNWISFSATMENKHGIRDVVLYVESPNVDSEVPDEYIASEEPEEETEPPTEAPVETEPTVPETEPPMTTPPEAPVEEWGGVKVGEDAEIHLGNVIQIGDTAFNYFKFSQSQSDRFIRIMTRFSEAMAEKEDITITTVLVPTSVGIMVEPEYQEKIGCVDQREVIDYIYSGIPDDIIKVNLFDTLVEHNDEYIYFRTDHHWTVQGGYYCYLEICKALDMEPAPLENFEELDMGEFKGSNYFKCKQSSKLTVDNVYAYRPYSDIDMIITNKNGKFHWDLISDMSRSSLQSKYLTFLAGDNPLSEITNNDLPEGKTCVIVKDSFANCVTPFLTQNYHKIYHMDFRKYGRMDLQKFVEHYDVDDVIFLVHTGAAQDKSYTDLIKGICGV